MVAHDLHDPAPQEHVVLHSGPTEIEPAVLEANLLTGELRRPRLEGRRLGLVEYVEFANHDLDLTGDELRVGGAGRAGTHRPAGSDDPLGPHRPRRSEDGRRAFRADDELRASPAVTEVDEDHALVITDAVDPAAEGHLASEVARSKFAAGVGSKHECAPFREARPRRLPLAEQGLEH